MNESNFTALNAVIKREFKRILSRKSIYVFYLVLPLVLFLIFALIYSKALIHDLPVAVYDEDRSEISTLITRYYDASSALHVVKYVNSYEEMKKEFLRGNIDGALYFPRDVEKNAKSGKQAHVVLYINSSNIIKNNYVLNDGLKILKTVSGGMLLKKFRSAGMTEKQAMARINPITVESQVLYNPNYSYKNYLVPTLTTFGIMMIVIVIAVLVISSEVSENTFGQLAKLAKGKAWIIMTGKAIPHLTFHVMNTIILTGFIFPLFSININGAVLPVLLYTIYFAVVVFALGMMISVIAPNEMFSTEAALLYVTPAFIFSGLTYPLWSMPKVLMWAAQFIPYTHFLGGYIKLYEMGLPLKYVMPETWALAIFLVVSVTVTFILLRIKIRKSRNENQI